MANIVLDIVTNLFADRELAKMRAFIRKHTVVLEHPFLEQLKENHPFSVTLGRAHLRSLLVVGNGSGYTVAWRILADQWDLNGRISEYGQRSYHSIDSFYAEFRDEIAFLDQYSEQRRAIEEHEKKIYTDLAKKRLENLERFMRSHGD
jgi:hypothetical protein